MPSLGIFGLEFSKNYCNILNQDPRGKTIMSTFGTKNAFFRYFWTRIFLKNCHIVIFVLLPFSKKLLSCLNQDLRICLNAKFREKMKMPKFGTKNVLFGYFWTGIFKNFCHIWVKHPQICQRWVSDSYDVFS